MSRKLRWTKENIRFTDHSRNFTAEEGTHEVPDDVAERYLSHRSDGWERVEDSASDYLSGSEADDGPLTDISGDDETDPDGYTREELEEMDYSELSTLAKESDDDSIHGRSSTEDIIEALAND